MRLDDAVDGLGLMPANDELETLQEVVAATRSLPRDQWGSLYPVLSQVAVTARSKPSDFERAMDRELQHLQEVCHRPRLQLRVEEERVAVGRARRFSPRATASLLAHPEDWEHCTPVYIQPRKVLAIQTNDEWDLYENRVAARLVDHLLEYVGRRIQSLTKLRRLVDGADFGAGVSSGRWRRQQRLSRLWAEQYAGGEEHGQLGETARLVQSLYGRLLALLESPLYKQIPKMARVSDHLHSTNILTNDVHYRHVARLWRLWLENAWKKPISTEEKRRKREEDQRHLCQFAEMLVRRALGPECVCEPGEGGILQVSQTNKSARLRLVLARVPQESSKAEALWTVLTEEKGIVLMVGDPSDLQCLSEPLRRRFGGWEQPRVLPVSPWTLESAEGVARLLQLEFARQAICTWPPTISLTSDSDLPEDPALKCWHEGRKLTVGVMRRADQSVMEKVEKACKKREAEDLELRRRKLAVEQNRTAHLHQLLHFLSNEREYPPGKCFACAAEGVLEVRGGESPEKSAWWARCPSCSAEWGWQRCGSCMARFLAREPYPREVGDGLFSPEEMDRRFGQELQAEPCWKRGASKWRCPHCRTCSGGQCGRCTGNK